MTTTFTPGDAVGVCGPVAHLIAGIRLDDPRLPRLWEVLSRADAGAVDGVLEVLLDGGFADMPAFAVATSSGTTTRVVVRHPAVVEATVAGAVQTLTSTPGGTWSDVAVDGVTELVLRAAEATGPSAVQLPFHAGMTPAAAVRIVLDAEAATPAAPAAPVAPAPAAAPEPADVEPADVEPADVEPADVEPAADEPGPVEPTEEKAPEEATPLTAVWRTDEPAGDEPAVADAPTTDEPATEEPAAEAATEEAPEPEPLAAEEPVAEEPAVEEPEDATVLRPATPPPAPPAPAPAPASGGSGLIDGVPWLSANWSSTAAEPARPAPKFETPPAPAAIPTPPSRPATPPPPPAPATSSPAPADDEGDDAPTVLRGALIKEMEMGSAGIVGPSVLAVDCPNGHQTSAHEATCRLCGAELPDTQEPRQIPRPALGALVLASGDRLVLDKDAVLGRAPYEPEGSTERPHLVRVGESGDISRQHARIKLDGWHVSVRDLGTANGTTLTLPGGSPQQLRANEDYQLEDGAEIGIADVVTLRYEVKP